MARLGSYHLARVVKLQISSDDILEAIRNPISFGVGEFSWTFSDYRRIELGAEVIHFCRLTKYLPQGELPTIDSSTHTTVVKLTPDMIDSSSPFVFLPDHSAVGFLHIWNRIEEGTFRKRFGQLVVDKYDHFFADCTLEPISDLSSFLSRVGSMSSLDRISAKVNPPNPSFGHLWRDLNEYMTRRQTDELTIDETSAGGLRSELPEVVRSVNADSGRVSAASRSLPIGDAAIMMAVDGYGRGKIEGRLGDTRVTVNTSDNAIVLKLPSEPDPVELYGAVRKRLVEIDDERRMEHK